MTLISGPLRGKKIGLLGGSFNPAHDGHIDISLAALSRLRLDAVWWLVSPHNPLKPAAGMASLEDRLTQAKSIATDRRIHVTDIETKLGTRYTADTLAVLTSRAPATRFVWLMGADNLVQIPRWRRWTHIFETMPVAVFARHSYDLKSLAGRAAARYKSRRIPARLAAHIADYAPPAWTFVVIRHNLTSATAIRASGAARPGSGKPDRHRL